MKKEELEKWYSKKTWNRIKNQIPEQFSSAQTIKTWVDFRGNEKKVNLEEYKDKEKIFLYTHCKSCSKQFISKN